MEVPACSGISSLSFRSSWNPTTRILFLFTILTFFYLFLVLFRIKGAASISDGSTEDYYGLVMAVGRSGNCKMSESSKTTPPTKKSRKYRNQGKLGGSNHTTEVMEELIWKDFPEDLFESVIARLPVATFFRFRSVCRKWNNLLNSESFSEHCAQVPQSSPWLYTISDQSLRSGAIYDPSTTQWHHSTISSIQTKLLPVASAGGLVCFLDGQRNFYVSNPLTQSLKELPASSVKVRCTLAVGMTTYGNSASVGYMILWVRCNGEYQVYDSVKNSWTRPGNLPESIKLPLGLHPHSLTLSIDDMLLFLRSDPEGVVSYNVALGIWEQFVIPSPLDMTDHTLAECKGRLILVGLVTKNAATYVCVWELQKMTLLWKEVDRMPNICCLEFNGKKFEMTCLGNKGLLMLSLTSSRMSRLVTYNVSSREWAKVPGCVGPRGRRRQSSVTGIAFYPHPTSVA